MKLASIAEVKPILCKGTAFRQYPVIPPLIFFLSAVIRQLPQKTNLLVNLKKTFFLFLPSHPHNPAGSPVFIVVSVVRASVRASDLPSHSPHTTLTLPSHYPHTPPTLPARKLLVSDSMDVMKSFFREYEQWFIVSIAMLHYWYTYAGLLVYLCWTVGTSMLYFSGTVFS